MQTIVDFLHSIVSLAKPSSLKHLIEWSGTLWLAYALLFAIVFSETGLLVGFFLPGDSLLFAAGFLASPAGENVLDIVLLNVVLMFAAIAGDAVNYAVGVQLGVHVFDRDRFRFIKRDHLLAAQAFYEKHGGKAIVLARFIPLVRTFTPFVAGVARMSYRQFLLYNVVGGMGWVASMTLAGYWLGQYEVVQKNFELAVIAVILISLLPVLITLLKRREPKPTLADKN